MKEQLQNSFKETPQRFRYAVTSAIEHAASQKAIKNLLTKKHRIVIALALIAAIIPTSVFGATKLYAMRATRVDNYGLALSVESQNPSDYPEYVKMKITVPDGFIVEPNTDELKYTERNSDGSIGDGSLSLCPMRPNNGSDTEVVGNVSDYEEVTLCGHTAYRIRQTGNGWDRIYISFENADVLLLVYYNNITEEQLADFVGGIAFTEGTATDHTELWEFFDERDEDKVMYTFGYTNIEFPRDTVMTFSRQSGRNSNESLCYTARISDVRIVDNLNDLDSSLFNQMYTDNDLTNKSGELLPRKVTVTKSGDGFNTVDEVISSEEKEQKLILVDLSYTNLSSEDTVVYIPYTLETFDKEPDGTYDYSWNIDPENRITSSEYCDSEPLYVSDPLDTESSFYCTTLKANETKTVTIGFRCCTDALDKAYLTIIDATSESITDPAPQGYNGNGNIPNYIIKVTDNDR